MCAMPDCSWLPLKVVVRSDVVDAALKQVSPLSRLTTRYPLRMVVDRAGEEIFELDM